MWHVLVVLLSVAACSGVEEVSGVQGCIERNPATQPFDVGDIDIAAPMPGSTQPAPPPPSATDLAEVCRTSGGSGCNPDQFISKNAASCIAQLNDFEAGLQPWRVALVYHHRFERVVWNVMSRLQDRGRDGYAGGLLTLDATDGVVLDRGGYDATP
jgi:hypothetical protein